MISDEWQINNYDEIGNHLECWLMTTEELLLTANILKGKRIDYFMNIAKTLAVNQPIPPEGRILNCELMLKGFAIECLLKAIWVKRGNKLAANGKLQKIPNVGSHKLVQLMMKLEINITPQQKDLLNRLETYLTSIGRYPIAKTWESTKIVSPPERSNTRWAMPTDDKLFDSLVCYLKEEC